MIPKNWKEPEEYPAQATDKKWAWEFLRRNLQYQNAWRKGISEKSPDSWRTFQVREYLDPAIDFDENTHANLFMPGSLLEIRSWLTYRTEPLLEPTKNGEVIIKFDVTMNIDRQIEQARYLLNKETIIAKVKSVEMSAKQHQRSNFRNYLRLLDAETEFGCSDSDLLKQVVDEFSKPLKLDKFSRPGAIKALRYQLKTARDYRDRDYRALVMDRDEENRLLEEDLKLVQEVFPEVSLKKKKPANSSWTTQKN